MNVAYLLTGGNTGDRLQHINAAAEAIKNQCGSIVKKSTVYETAAWGKEDQPDYLNQAVGLETDLSAEQLLHQCMEIEHKLGRTRDVKWESRLMDIDILFYGEKIVDSPQLKVPHPFLQVSPKVPQPFLRVSGVLFWAPKIDSSHILKRYASLFDFYFGRPK